MGGLSGLVRRVLFVTRAGGSGSGGAVGHGAALDYYLDELKSAQVDVYQVALPGGPTLLRKWRTFSGLKHGHLSGVSHTVLQDFAATLKRLRPSLVLLDSSLFGPLARLARDAGCITVTQLQNCEFDFYAGESALRSGVAAALLRAAYLAEAQALEASHLVLALSEHDRQRLARLYEVRATLLVVNPMLQRLSSGLHQQLSKPSKVQADPARFVFLASDSSQNRLACQWLLDRWSSSVATLIIAGRIGDWALRTQGQAHLSRRGIEVTGFIPSLGELLEECTAMLCPMWLGSGVKVKMIDALAHACPVYATPEAMEGFHFADGSNMVSALNESLIQRAMDGSVTPSGDSKLLCEQVDRELETQRRHFMEALEATCHPTR